MTDAPLVFRIISAFFVIGGLLYAFAVIARRRMGTMQTNRRERLIKVIETTRLAQAVSLHVIKIGERYEVIALSPSGVSRLTEIDPPIVERWAQDRKPTRAARGHEQARGQIRESTTA